MAEKGEVKVKTLGQIKSESKPETLLRKRDRADEEKIFEQVRKQREEQLARKQKSKSVIKNAASFIASSRNKTKSEKALLVRTKKERPDIPSDGRLVLVIKIHPSVDAANQIKKAIQELGLSNKYSAAFARCDKHTHQLLKIAEPFVTFGEPTQEIIEKLVRKRARVLKNGEEVALKDNTYVEETLGALEILCIEDIIHEIATVGDHFEEVQKFLCAFRLNHPQQSFKKKPVSRGGDFGNRGTKINETLNSMI